MLLEHERAELAILLGRVEAEEGQALAPELTRLRAEIAGVEHELARVEGENEELARLMAQQEALVADARSFIAEFDRRRTSILDGLARLAGTLPST